MLRALAIAATAVMMAAPASFALAAPQVVATTKPLHSLVASVMAGVGEPVLLVKGAASAHTYSLRPSDARALGAADVVFWTGHGMELFLDGALETLAPDAAIVALAETEGLELLPIREGGAFEPHVHGIEAGHDHDHDHDHAHGHDEADMHYWLDPDNAALMVGQIAQTLADADPQNAAAYRENAAAEAARLTALTADLETILAPARGRSFVVFHDAYQYFEQRFGLTVAGTITVSPDVPPGAQRIADLRERVQDDDVACIFAEPQFEPAVVRTIAEGTGVRVATLDPEGAGLEEGATLYDQLLRGLATAIADCVAGE